MWGDERNLHKVWQQIAAQASKETDPDKLAKMIEELRRALKLHEEGHQVIKKQSILGL